MKCLIQNVEMLPLNAFKYSLLLNNAYNLFIFCPNWLKLNKAHFYYKKSSQFNFNSAKYLSNFNCSFWHIYQVQKVEKRYKWNLTSNGLFFKLFHLLTDIKETWKENGSVRNTKRKIMIWNRCQWTTSLIIHRSYRILFNQILKLV